MTPTRLAAILILAVIVASASGAVLGYYVSPNSNRSIQTITLTPSTIVYSQTTTVTTTLATSIIANPITSTLSQISTTTRTVSNSTTVTRYQSVSANYSPTGLSGNSTNLTLGIRLQFSINTTSVFVNQMMGIENAILVDISDSNALSSTNNISYSGGWPIFNENVTAGICNQYGYPFGIIVFKGYFDSQNVSTAKSSTRLFPTAPCPLGLVSVSYYIFAPNSNLAAILSSRYYTSSSPYTTTVTTQTSYAPRPMTENISLTGSCPCAFVGGFANTPFGSGTYTIVGEDNWGNVIVLHFSVGNS